MSKENIETSSAAGTEAKKTDAAPSASTAAKTADNSQKKKKKKFKSSSLRIVTATVALIAFAVALFVNVPIGTVCSYGWGSISLMCPLGALTTMIASRTVVPHAVIALCVMLVIIFLLGRVFCGWVCPIPLLKRLRNFFTPAKKRRQMEADTLAEVQHAAKAKISCGGDCGENEECTSCMPRQHKFDGRHVVLGGAVVSTAIFGFPVFCIVCPIGLTFGTILVIYRLFAFGDTTWSALLVPVLLIIEVFALKKWCTHFCPLSALMDLFARFSQTWHPVIDDKKCIETSSGHACSRCAAACPEGINLRNPEFGENTIKDCTRCRQCVDACPEHAIKMPLITPRAYLKEHKDPKVQAELRAKAKAEKDEKKAA